MLDTSKISTYFTLDANLKRLEEATVLKSPIMDTVYPEEKREQYQSSIVKRADLPSAIKNAPLVIRGDSAFEMPGKLTTIDGYEPYAIELSKRIPGAELNDIISSLNNSSPGTAKILDIIVERMRKTVRATTEALAGQSLHGSISYPLKGSDTPYTVSFGNTKKAQAKTKLSDGSATIETVLNLIYEMADQVSSGGFGQEIVVFAGREAFSGIIKMIAKGSNSSLGVQVTQDGIIVPGVTIKRNATSYFDYASKKEVQVIDDKKLCAVAIDAPHWLPYCALDDIGANMAALPFFTSYEIQNNPSALDIYGKSKPFPVPVVDNICWSDDII